jgi:hypothetical protein
MKKDIFQPTFDKVILLAGITPEEFTESMTDIAVEFTENFLGKSPELTGARQALYTTPEFWVWFKRLLANASLAWIQMVEERTFQEPERRWEYWQRSMRTYMHLYRPTEIVIKSYTQKLQLAA